MKLYSVKLFGEQFIHLPPVSFKSKLISKY